MESVTGGYGKSISHVIIGLKTVKGTKQLKLDPTIYDAIIKEKVTSLFTCGNFKKMYIFDEFTFCIQFNMASEFIRGCGMSMV